MTTPHDIHVKRVEAERQAKEGMVKIAHAKELEKQAMEAEVRLKKEEMLKAQEELRRQQRDLEKMKAHTPS